MKKALNSPAAKAVIFIVIIGIFTMTTGTLLKFPLGYMLGSIIVFILLGIIFFLYKKIKDIKKAENIEKSVKNQAAYQMQHLSPEKRAEILQFTKQLEAAITSLKNSKIGKGKTGKAALYALPWYIIIGPSAAGKTTAIQNSGLEFPFGRDAFRGVGGTRNCDWFFSNQGIFLDTAGRYVSQAEDRAEWISFLEVLKKNRPKKPVNGVIAALNIDELINCDKIQIEEHAQNIRQRIDELIQNLGVTFPVYFIFTKCDLVQGFVDIFSDLSETERSQIWGASFSQMDEAEILRDRIENEFNLLASKIFEMRSVRLSDPLKREQRRNVYLFPFQFNSLREKVVYFLSELFQHNPYQDDPLFRGFYFTSGTQEGAPLDIAIRAIVKQFDLQHQFIEENNGVLEKKQYFIKDLLTEVIIGDKDYVISHTSGFIRKRNKSRLAINAVSVIILILWSILVYHAYTNSMDAMDRINNTAGSFASVNWKGDLLKNFRESEKFLNVVSDISNGDAVKSNFTFGMDHTPQSQPYLENLYIKKTTSFFIQNVYTEIEKELDNYANGQDYPGEQIYNDLRAYLLLGIERERMDTSEARFLKNVSNKILQSRYLITAPVSSLQRDSLKKYFDHYINSIAAKFPDSRIYPVENDKLLISLVRSRMQYQPGVENLYARLKQDGINQLTGEISLEDIITGRFTGTIYSDMKIPYLFTPDGWKNFVRQEISNISRNPEEEDWVLGKQRFSPSVRLSSEEIRNTLLNMYLNDYKQSWIQMLHSIKYKEFENVPEAALNMKDLSDPVNGPLVVLLKDFAAQMKEIAEIVQLDSGKTSFSPQIDVSEVNNYLKLVLSDQGTLSKEMTAIVSNYGVISSILESIKDDPELSKDYAAKVLGLRAIEFPGAFQQIKGTLYNASSLQDLFLTPIRFSWKAILSEASNYLNSQWKQRVTDIFNKSIAASFPFRKNGPDAPIQDFKDFFNPQNGVLWEFVNQELAGFIKVGKWTPLYWENEGISVSKEAIEALKKAEDISNTLFRNSELNVSFRLKPQIPQSRLISEIKPIVEQIYLSIDNVDNYYKMGAPFWTDYSWPGSKGVPGARMNISIKNYGSTETKGYDGEWALFRLFSDASIAQGETPNQYICNWFFRNDNKYDVLVTYVLNAAGTKNPFSPDFFRSFRLPDKLN